MLNVTIKGPCPHCGKIIAFSASALTDTVPDAMPEALGARVVRDGLLYVVMQVRSEPTASGTGLIVTYNLMPLEGRDHAG